MIDYTPKAARGSPTSPPCFANVSIHVHDCGRLATAPSENVGQRGLSAGTMSKAPS